MILLETAGLLSQLGSRFPAFSCSVPGAGLRLRQVSAFLAAGRPTLVCPALNKEEVGLILPRVRLEIPRFIFIAFMRTGDSDALGRPCRPRKLFTRIIGHPQCHAQCVSSSRRSPAVGEQPHSTASPPVAPGVLRQTPLRPVGITSHEYTRTGLRHEALQAKALGACAERAYAGPFKGFLEEEVMRRTSMPITEVIVWLQAEQKAEARKRQKLQRRKRERLQKQPRPEGRRRTR